MLALQTLLDFAFEKNKKLAHSKDTDAASVHARELLDLSECLGPGSSKKGKTVFWPGMCISKIQDDLTVMGKIVSTHEKAGYHVDPHGFKLVRDGPKRNYSDPSSRNIQKDIDERLVCFCKKGFSNPTTKKEIEEEKRIFMRLGTVVYHLVSASVFT